MELLATFLNDDRCQIEELSLHEADLADDVFQVIINALKENNKIERLSLAKNEMNRQICNSALKLARSQNQMVRLCLAHCEITDEGMSIINNGLQNTNIRYLNISWNNLTPVSMESLTNFVSTNPNLEKLLI